MKFNHDFKLIKNDASSFLFACEGKRARIDFFDNNYRVAIYDEGARLFPTFSVCPSGELPFEGRERLSVEGLNLTEPKLTYFGKDDNKCEPDEDISNIHFNFGNYTLKLELHNFRLSLFKQDLLLYEDRENLAYNLGHEMGSGECHYVSRQEEEQIFGLGDKTGDVNKAHRSFRLGTNDAMGFDARFTDPLYKHVPFYMCKNSNGAYGFFYDTYSDGMLDFGREHNNYYPLFKSFKCEEEALVYYCFTGNLQEILVSFAKLRGRDFLPPYWTFKYCGSTMTYTDAPDADRALREFVKNCKDYELNPGGFYLSSGYTQIGEKRYVFNWNTDKIPSPEDLSDYFRENGIEFLPNIKPCLLTDHPMYAEVADKGYFLKDKDGKPAVFPFWGGFGSYIDFTNRQAAAFWTKCVKEILVERGYCNTWNDNNEYDINDPEVYADGFGSPVPAKLIKPLFSLLMTRASLEGQSDDRRKNAVSRCGTTGLSRMASTWTGDNKTDFADFRYNHKMAMTMSLSGIYNFGQDIGGFSGPQPEKELFLRWIQYGIFTPRFVIHSWKPDAEPSMPWLYPEEKDTIKKLFALRDKLTPYLYNEAWRSTLDYRPIIYPVFLKVPDYDPESDAFFFGDSIIAVPVFDKGCDTVSVLLPENNGGWYYGTDDSPEKGKVSKTVGIHDEPAYFIRGGSLLYDGDTFTIYPLENGSFTCDYLLDDGVSVLKGNNHSVAHFEVNCDESVVSVCVSFSGESVYKNKVSADRLSLIDANSRKFEVVTSGRWPSL